MEKMRSSIEWRDRIRQALAESRFVPWFQPILDLRDGGVHHYEALARLHQPDGQIVLPGAFIETAERFGLIGEIDRAIAESTMRIEARGPRPGGSPAFAMNLSAKVLGDPDTGHPESPSADRRRPARLILIWGRGDPRRGPRARLHRRPPAASAAASLSTISASTSRRSPTSGWVDYIKIDGSFVRRLRPPRPPVRQRHGRRGRGMGIRTIAEFVEPGSSGSRRSRRTMTRHRRPPDLLEPAALESARALVPGAPAPAVRLVGRRRPSRPPDRAPASPWNRPPAPRGSAATGTARRGRPRAGWPRRRRRGRC